MSTNNQETCDLSVEQRQELMGELEHRLLMLADRLRCRIAAAAAEFGLTPQQAIVIRNLDRPRTAGELAAVYGCDPSNVTGLTTRLEQRGLLRREVDPDDRRVKRLVLTEDGRAVRAALQERLIAESPATAGLEISERRALLMTVRKLTSEIGQEAGDGMCGITSD